MTLPPKRSTWRREPGTPYLKDGRWMLTIPGELASKSNSRRIVWVKGRPRSIKSEKALLWEAHVQEFVRALAPKDMLTGPVRIFARVYYASRRPDLDVALLMDALQGKLYVNDRQVWGCHSEKWFDADSPRVELEVEPLEESAVAAREVGLPGLEAPGENGDDPGGEDGEA